MTLCDPFRLQWKLPASTGKTTGACAVAALSTVPSGGQFGSDVDVMWHCDITALDAGEVCYTLALSECMLEGRKARGGSMQFCSLFHLTVFKRLENLQLAF